MRGETLCCLKLPHIMPISIHSPHARGDQAEPEGGQITWNFNPLPSCEGRHTSSIESAAGAYISIHSPHARGDKRFYSMQDESVISIHSPHARGDQGDQACGQDAQISIHSPHARGDHAPVPKSRGLSDFNPLPSCEGRPAGRSILHRAGTGFQSTPLMRGETFLLTQT